MTYQEKTEAVKKVLKSIADGLEQALPENKFYFLTELKDWHEVRYVLVKNSKKQDVILTSGFVSDVILGLYPVSELIAACKYELERIDK